MLVILGPPPNVEGAKLLKMLVCWDELCILASRRDLAKGFGTFMAAHYCKVKLITEKLVISK